MQKCYLFPVDIHYVETQNAELVYLVRYTDEVAGCMTGIERDINCNIREL